MPASPELAKKLHEAGLFPAKIQTIQGWEIDFRPSLEDIINEIERLVPDADIVFGKGVFAPGRYCDVIRNHYEPNEHCWEGSGPNDTEAAGYALLKVMEEMK